MRIGKSKNVHVKGQFVEMTSIVAAAMQEIITKNRQQDTFTTLQSMADKANLNLECVTTS